MHNIYKDTKITKLSSCNWLHFVSPNSFVNS